MASIVHNRGKREALKGAIAWESDTLKVLLVTSSYTPDPDHNFVSSANAAELSGTGYVSGFAGSGRKALANKLVTQDDTNNLAIATADATEWAGINAGAAAWAIIYKPGTSDADSVIIATIDIPDVTTNGTAISVSWPEFAAGGIWAI
jgi:hypothetical protein